MTTRQGHWAAVYATKGERDVSWYEAAPTTSVRMVEAAGLSPGSRVIDVGAGESRLVDYLLARGVSGITVLDVSGEALERARRRLGDLAARVTWIEADVTGHWSCDPVDIWHDRAAFHFLTEADDRARYVANLCRTLKPHGAVIIATFALDGPATCSGLPVMRYSPETLAAELGSEFELVDSASHVHRTPWGAAQAFQYSRFIRHSSGADSARTSR